MKEITCDELEQLDGGSLFDWVACGAVVGVAIGVAAVAIGSGGAAALAVPALGGEAGAAAWFVGGIAACGDAIS